MKIFANKPQNLFDREVEPVKKLLSTLVGLKAS